MDNPWNDIFLPSCLKVSNLLLLATCVTIYTVNPLLSPPGDLFFSSTFDGGLNREGGGLKERGGLFNLAKHITCSKNTVVSDRVDLRVVQLKSLSKVFNSLVGA